MASHSEIARSFTESLELTPPPIAIFLTDRVPACGARCGGRIPAGCRFWQEAANRVFATSAGDHDLCSIGLYTHNLDMAPAAATDLGDALKVFAQLTYVRDEDVASIAVLAFRA